MVLGFQYGGFRWWKDEYYVFSALKFLIVSSMSFYVFISVGKRKDKSFGVNILGKSLELLFR